MPKADSVYITPPTNTPVVDTTRRRFLTVAAIGSMIGAGSLAAVAMAPNDVPKAVVAVPIGSPSHRLRAAILQLAAAHETLIAAQATAEEAETMWTDWEAQNPQPASKRGTREWIKRGNAYHRRFTAPSWQALMDAELVFSDAQDAVADVPIAGPADLDAMTAASVIYDHVDICRHNRAAIARVVAAEYFRLGKAVLS
jgi:hypothetical protein